jgi:hypothetical protein
VMQQRVGLAAPPDGHHQRIHDQRGIAVRLHRLADDAPGEEVQHDGDIELALHCPDVSEVGSHEYHCIFAVMASILFRR